MRACSVENASSNVFIVGKIQPKCSWVDFFFPPLCCRYRGSEIGNKSVRLEASMNTLYHYLDVRQVTEIL